MSRVITVTQVHFQACKWFAICWLSYANVPCGVLTSWGGGSTMGARGRPAGLEQGKDTRVRFFFFKREELENFQRSRLSPVKTSSYFSSSSSSPPFLNFCWTVARRTLFFSPIPNQLMRGSCFWMCFSFQRGKLLLRLWIPREELLVHRPSTSLASAPSLRRRPVWSVTLQMSRAITKHYALGGQLRAPGSRRDKLRKPLSRAEGKKKRLCNWYLFR